MNNNEAIVTAIEQQTAVLQKVLEKINSNHNDSLKAQQMMVKVKWPKFDPDSSYRCISTYVERAVSYADSDVIYLVLDDDNVPCSIPGHSLRPHSTDIIPIVWVI